jgi:TRAP-type C4-dicarboxylate transport system substrate-binding protein
MRKKIALIFILCMQAAAAVSGLTIKLGSLAPVGSPWDVALHRIAEEWLRISKGGVEVKIYAGGITGDEPDMVRKIRIGQLGAAAITVSGLQGIYNGVKALSYPLFIRTDAELADVLGRMEPFLDQQLEQRGFKVAMWSAGGWVYFFSREPIVTPGDLKKQKLWVWVGDPAEVKAWQSAGFQVVPLASTDILTSLQGGMIDALVTSPLVAASNQWFGVLSRMCGLKLGPLWGAMIVSTRIWGEVPADLQPRLVEAAQKISDSMTPQFNQADRQAISVMSSYGLKITEVPKSAEKLWQDIIDKGFSELIGTSFDRAAFNLAQRYLGEYLAAHPGGR